MKYQDEVEYWCDISIVALESVMSLQGEVDSIQYNNVRDAAINIMTHLRNNMKISKDIFQLSIEKFLQTRDKFVEIRNSPTGNELFKSTPVDLVSATIVAMCVGNSIAEEISLDEFDEIVNQAYSYMSNYNFRQ